MATDLRSWLDDDPPANPSLAAAYWCDMDYFLAHTAYGAHPDCRCTAGEGHNDPAFDAKREAHTKAKESHGE